MRYENNEEDIFVRLKNMELISPNDPQRKRIKEASEETRKLVRKLNNSDDGLTIRLLLSKITGQKNNSVEVFTPIYINYGKNLKMGYNVFINFDCTLLDLGGITIEDDVQIGPKVSLITENHPLNADDRKGLVCKPILIKKNAWIGANATILPGITIGENAVIAAGAVVSKDVEANTIVAGIPAKVIKSI